MTVTIVGFQDMHFTELETAMEKLISQSQCFLFNVLASKGSVGERWAQKNGAPIVYPTDKTLEFLIKNADYFMIYNDGSKSMHKLIFQIMKSGKHGTILGQEYKK